MTFDDSSDYDPDPPPITPRAGTLRFPDPLVAIKSELQKQEAQAGEDAVLALQANEDQKYWAALGRQTAYRHAVNLIAGRDSRPRNPT